MPEICPQCGKEHATQIELEALATDTQKPKPKKKGLTLKERPPWEDQG